MCYITALGGTLELEKEFVCSESLQDVAALLAYFAMPVEIAAADVGVLLVVLVGGTPASGTLVHMNSGMISRYSSYTRIHI